MARRAYTSGKIWHYHTTEVTVDNSGLIIDSEHYHLAASPDGLLSCLCHGSWKYSAHTSTENPRSRIMSAQRIAVSPEYSIYDRHICSTCRCSTKCMSAAETFVISCCTFRRAVQWYAWNGMRISAGMMCHV